jgi:hypothetical protein
MRMMQPRQSRKTRVPSDEAHIEVSLPRKRASSPTAYMRDMATEESVKAMVYWIAEAAKEAREEAGRLQVHVAAGLDKNQSAIARFEDHKNQPRDLDQTIAAYAEDLDIDPRQLWARALEMWIAAEAPAPAAAARGLQAVAQIAKRAAGKQGPTRKKQEVS